MNRDKAFKAVSYSLEQTAEALGVDAERVKLPAGQGRIDARTVEGEKRYEAASVLRFRAEDLIRELLAEARPQRSTFSRLVNELANVQYQRGLLEGTVETGEVLYERVMPMIEEQPERVMRGVKARREREGSA
jgi:hypothetical protein